MWLLAVAIFAGCKILTWWWRRERSAPAWLHMAYLLAWPGLDVDAFLRPLGSHRVARPSLGEWFLAGIKLAIGLTLVFFGARMIATSQPYAAGWVGMIGVVLALHFGLFHLLSCAWRSIGLDAKPLMTSPLRATSLSEFWGKRWNTALCVGHG